MNPSDYAILALSHQKLGNAERAKEYFEMFQVAFKSEGFKDDDEVQRFALELAEFFPKPRK